MSMNRDDRRKMKKRLAPIAKRVAFLEKQIKSGLNTEAAEAEISEIMDKLSMIEMMALEDYIVSNHLLDNK
jgi:hypothetical protein